MFISTLVKCILVQSPGRPAAAGTQRLSRCSPCLPHIRRLLLTSQPAGSACGLVQAALLRLLVQLRPCCWLPVCAVCCLVLQLRCGPCGTACVLLHQRRMKAHIQCHWCCGLRKNGCHPGSQRRLHLSCCCLLSRIRSAGCCCPAAATAAAVIEWLPLVLISRLFLLSAQLLVGFRTSTEKHGFCFTVCCCDPCQKVVATARLKQYRYCTKKYSNRNPKFCLLSEPLDPGSLKPWQAPRCRLIRPDSTCNKAFMTAPRCV